MSLRTRWRERAQRAELYATADYWDSKAAAYEGSSVSMWPNGHLNALYQREQFGFLDEAVGDIGGREVLDVGCGTGRISRHLASRGGHVTGFDFSERAIEIARRESPPEIDFRVESVFEFDDEARFDVAISWGILTVACRNRDELATALRRIRAALRPAGRAVIVEPIHVGFLSRVLSMDLREFCETMREAGFQVERVDQLHFWPARLALAYFEVPAFITRPVYVIGQALMRLPGLRRLGDYKAIVAHAR